MFLPHTPKLLSFEVATEAARGGFPGLIEQQTKAKKQRQKSPP